MAKLSLKQENKDLVRWQKLARGVGGILCPDEMRLEENGPEELFVRLNCIG